MSKHLLRLKACGFIVGVITSLFFSGCGETASDVPEVFPVSGTVTLKGKPLEGARVVFLPEKEAACAGITDAQGKYVLKHRSGQEGAPAGPAKVEITTDLEGSGDPAAEKVPAMYNKSSQLSKSVKKENNIIDFKLE